jgi:hypothetical protein
VPVVQQRHWRGISRYEKANSACSTVPEATSLFYHPQKDGPVVPYEVMKKGMQEMTPEQFVQYVKKKKQERAEKEGPQAKL